LIAAFGRSYGAWLHDAAHGRDERPVVTHSEPVSISRETTFERDLHAQRDRAELGAIFTRLCEQVAADLQRKGYVGRTVGIKLRFEDFRTVTRDLTLPEPTADAAEIRRAASACLKRVDLKLKLRLLGVRAGSLAKPGQAVAARRRRPAAGDRDASDELPFEHSDAPAAS
jgi:DNA polymerase-4